MMKARKMKFGLAEFTYFVHVLAPKPFLGQVRSLTYDVILKGLHRLIWADLSATGLGHLYSTMLARKCVGWRIT